MAKVVRIDDDVINPLTTKKPLLLYVSLGILFVSVNLSLFSSNFSAFLSNGIGFLMLLGSTWLISKGAQQKTTYHNTAITKAPNIHYLLMGALALGVTTSFLSFFNDKGFLVSLFVGTLATVGSLLYYGNDPKRDKTSTIQGISTDLVIDTINEANTKIDSIETGIKKINDPKLSASLNNATVKARQIVKTIEKDPKDIRVSRKFLIIYVDGVKNIVESYNQMDSKDINEETRQKLYTLFQEVDTRFEKELQRLKNNNQFDLDVHIDTLKEQIKH